VVKKLINENQKMVRQFDAHQRAIRNGERKINSLEHQLNQLKRRTGDS